MFDPTAMVLADRATRRHLLSARPDRPTLPHRPPRRPAVALRRGTAVALHRLADRLEPRRVGVPTPAPR